MVLSKFGNLARTSLGKTLTHVPQTVVAGTQSSYASTGAPFAFNNHGTGKFAKSTNAHLHTSFQSPSSPATAKNKAAPGSSNGGEKGDSGLAAYYDAWQKQHQPGAEEKEWKQFQFTKRIGWKAPTAAVLAGRAKEREELGLRPEARLDHAVLNRAYSESVVQDLKQNRDDQVEAEAIAAVDEAIAVEISQIKAAAAQKEKEDATPLHSEKAVMPSEEAHIVAGLTGKAAISLAQEAPSLSKSSVLSSTPVSPGTSLHSSLSTGPTAEHLSLTGNEHSSLISTLTATTSQGSSEQIAYSEQLLRLDKEQHYAEIPAVFESMLASGIRPTIEAYNALLSAITHSQMGPYKIVFKVLDVYTDLLRRAVEPDTTFYTTIINVLSTHALETFATRKRLDQQRIRFGKDGHALFASKDTEYALLVDDALDHALRIFDASVVDNTRSYLSEIYRTLIQACAIHGKIDDMIRVELHMEAHGVLPHASIYPSMISAFAAKGDLRSAVECYDAYKAIATSHTLGQFSMIGRNDPDVYAAVIKAYLNCNRQSAAWTFWDKIRSSNASTDVSEEHREEVQDRVVVGAVIADLLDRGDFVQALRYAEEQQLTRGAYNDAMKRICTAAADNFNTQTSRGDTDLAELAANAFDKIDSEEPVDSQDPADPKDPSKTSAAVAMLACHVRKGDIAQARKDWTFLLNGTGLNGSGLDISFAEGVAMYATALADRGLIDEGLAQACVSFDRIRADNRLNHRGAMDKIDEAIEYIGSHIARQGIFPSPTASISFMRAMMANRGFVSPVTEHLMAGLGPHNIDGLGLQDLYMALHAQSEILSHGAAYDAGHVDRFHYLMDTVMATGTSPPEELSQAVQRAAKSISQYRPDLSVSWQNFLGSFIVPAYVPIISGAPIFANGLTDNSDPYAASIDAAGSAFIIHELDNYQAKPADALERALKRFTNMRQLHRHPKYYTIARLLTATAKVRRIGDVLDILGAAEHDMPLRLNNPMVLQGWSIIWDAMVGACLTLNDRVLAAQYHQNLLDIGYAPSANTFGLYITTLKSNADEASEAVDIFNRSQREGVLPTSFLFNTVMGKLAKARRNNDCLWYFNEMSRQGVLRTSVSYGTAINACARVSHRDLMEELLDEMESMPNYRPRPAPYNTMLQFYLNTSRDRSKFFDYYNRMRSRNIVPTSHTYKLLIDAHATLEPIDMVAAEGVLKTIRSAGHEPGTVHYAALIHAKGCNLQDMAGARHIFDHVLAERKVRPDACLYQSLFEAMVANHMVKHTESILPSMEANGVQMTPYIANSLIHGWATEKNITKAKNIYKSVGKWKREPSTYEAMTRAYIAVGDREGAVGVVKEMLARKYPAAVTKKVQDLLGWGVTV